MRERVFLGRIEIGTERFVAFILLSNSSDALIGTKLLKNGSSPKSVVIHRNSFLKI